jgi:hypothetical protein
VSDLTDADRALLATSGLHLDAAAAADGALAESRVAFDAMVETGCTVAQAAVSLGVGEAEVRRRILSGELYAVGMGGRRRLPALQFGDDGMPLPGLAVVLQALPSDLHSLEVEGFFTTPQPELELSGRAVTPRAWLGAGGDPHAVAALADDGW